MLVVTIVPGDGCSPTLAENIDLPGVIPNVFVGVRAVVWKSSCPLSRAVKVCLPPAPVTNGIIGKLFTRLYRFPVGIWNLWRLIRRYEPFCVGVQ